MAQISQTTASLPGSVASTAIPAVLLSARKDRFSWSALIALLVLWSAHVAATWREASVWWGDYGRWLHEIDRFAHGETLYRDYYWPYPPFAIWVFGSFAKLFGSGTEALHVATLVVSLIIYLAFFFYVERIVPSNLAALTVTAGVLLSAAYAQILSQPLPRGMYSPAAPVGFLFLISGILFVLNSAETGRTIGAVIAGILCGLCVLTKQDFWLPAGYLIVAGFILYRPLSRAYYTSVASLLTVTAGAGVVLHQSGWKNLIGIPTGFALVAEARGLGLPTWERVTAEIAALGALSFAFCFCLLIGRAFSFAQLRKWATSALLVFLLAAALHLTMSLYFGHKMRIHGEQALPSPTEAFLLPHLASNRQLALGSWQWLKLRLQLHLFPALLPVVVLLVVLFRARQISDRSTWRTVVFLLGLCVFCRARRLFEHVEWYHFLLEIPAYIMAAELLLPDPKKVRTGVRYALVCAALAGAYSYWFFGVGTFTRTGIGKLLITPRGTIRVAGYQIPVYERLSGILDSIDPDHKDPLFAFGFVGGFDYFLTRPNPSPLTLGFRLSNFPPQEALQRLENLPTLLVVDDPSVGVQPWPSPSLDLGRWDQKMQEGPYSRVDRSLFEALIARCGKLDDFIPEFDVYGCGSIPPER